MPKLTTWCETIVWKRYPECKPVNDGYYWFLFSSKDGSNYTLQTKWKDGYLKHLDDDEDVIAFADLPTGELGEEFGFVTAVGLRGINIKSLASNRVMAVVDDDVLFYNCHGEAVRDSDGEVAWIVDVWDWEETNFTLPEILGKWRLA